jgi:hypothetical protein
MALDRRSFIKLAVALMGTGAAAKFLTPQLSTAAEATVKPAIDCGYQKLPNGLTIQWGKCDGSGHAVFHKPFDMRPYSAHVLTKEQWPTQIKELTLTSLKAEPFASYMVIGL